VDENTPTRKALWSLAVVGVLVDALIPLIWIISLSLKNPTSIGDGSFLPTHWTLSNYSTVFKTAFFTSALRNSIGIALITTVIALTFASMAAYAITRLDFRARP
jgi:multiple sugar transport system permease protein